MGPTAPLLARRGLQREPRRFLRKWRPLSGKDEGPRLMKWGDVSAQTMSTNPSTGALQRKSPGDRSHQHDDSGRNKRLWSSVQDCATPRTWKVRPQDRRGSHFFFSSPLGSYPLRFQGHARPLH